MKKWSCRRLLALAAACLLLLSSCGGPAGPSSGSSSGSTSAETGDISDKSDISSEPVIPLEPEKPDLEDLIAELSLEEKVAQLFLVSCHEPGSAQRAVEFGAGALCLYADDFRSKDADQVREMTAALQSAAQIPLLIGVDEEGGTVCRVSRNPALRAEPFLSPRKLNETGGWELIERDTREKAELLLDLGINLNLAPVCDVPLSSSDYIYPRCFSTDGLETAQYIGLVVGIMDEEGLGSTLKHFPGYGGSSDTHQGMAYDTRPYEDFQTADFLPFQAGIAAGAGSVMVSHNIVQCMDPDYPASLSPEVHRILREELDFEGVIITDDLVMEAIGQFTGGQNAAVQALLAGNDLICCADFEESADAILAAVEEDILSPAQIDASVLRVLQWKEELGLAVMPE